MAKGKGKGAKKLKGAAAKRSNQAFKSALTRKANAKAGMKASDYRGAS